VVGVSFGCGSAALWLKLFGFGVVVAFAFKLPNYQVTQLPNLSDFSVSPWWIYWW
jgi:hypothetical protein